MRLREGADAVAKALEIEGAGVEREGGAVRAYQLQARRIDVDRHDTSAERRGDLDAEAADSAGADEDRQVARREAAAHDRLVGRRHRVGDDRERSEVEPVRIDLRVAEVGHRTEPARRHYDVRGEAALDVVAGEDLVRADRAVTVQAGGALAARDDRRHDDVAPQPLCGAIAGRDHGAADLVAEGQRVRVPGWHPVVVEAEVGVTDAAAGDAHEDLARAGRGLACDERHRLAGPADLPCRRLHRGGLRRNAVEKPK